MKSTKLLLSLFVCTGFAVAMSVSIPVAQAYDPLTVSDALKVESLEFTVQDKTRDRQIPVRVYAASQADGATISMPVVLFSHGLGGSRSGNRFLGEHWAKRGYVAVFLQHPGSDESVWKETAMLKRMSAMRQAASAQNLFLRCEDVRVVLDHVGQWNQAIEHPLHNRMDMTRVGMSGHSFGAHTTQSVSGQTFPLIGQKYVDDRIDAAIAFSPSSPARGDKSAAFASVKVPWMLMTGTKDTAPIGEQSVESRLEVYPNLPKTLDKYELVLKNAEHSAFTDRALPGDREQRNANHHRAILALSTAFWDAYLKQDSAAQQWLIGDAAKQVLESTDRWQHQP